MSHDRLTYSKRRRHQEGPHHRSSKGSHEIGTRQQAPTTTTEAGSRQPRQRRRHRNGTPPHQTVLLRKALRKVLRLSRDRYTTRLRVRVRKGHPENASLPPSTPRHELQVRFHMAEPGREVRHEVYADR